MSVLWDGYEPYVPLQGGPLSEVPRREARAEFDRKMAAKGERIDELRRLLKQNDIDLGSTDEDIRALDDWFAAEVEPDGLGTGRLRNLWYAVVTDMGLFLGDVLIERAPGLHWELCVVGGKRNMHFQRHVVMGFQHVRDPRAYSVDFALNIAGYGQGLVAGTVPNEPHAILRMVLYNQSLA